MLNAKEAAEYLKAHVKPTWKRCGAWPGAGRSRRSKLFAGERLIIGVVMAIWIALLGSAMLIGWRQTQDAVIDLAEAEARSSFNKDLVYRKWNTMHGGVYVPPTHKTPPNPYLAHIPDRDVVTTGGMRLTLINPAYMTRQVHELGERQYGAKGHITSLNPIRPENAADAWETQALKTFQAGRAEKISSVEIMDGQPFLRFMKPMTTEKGCLRCHAAQGYREGDIRGGISVSVPFTPYLDVAGAQKRRLLLAYGTIGLLGVLGIWFAGRLIARSRERLQLERNQLLSIFDAIDEIVYVSDPVTHEVLYVNKATKTALRKDPVGGICYQEFQGMDAPCDFCINEMILKQKPDACRWEYHNPILNRTYDITARIINWPDGRDVRFELAIDITERKQAEAASQRLMLAIENTMDSIVITDPEGTIQYVNPAFERITGYSREEAVGENQRILKSGEHNEAFYKGMWDTLARGETWRGRIINKKKDGPLFTEEVTISPVIDATGKTTNYIAVKRDITQRLQLEKEKALVENQYRQAQKVESIGRLAGGVAHDLNNLLLPIIGYSEMLQEDLGADDARRDQVAAILSSGLRAQDLVHQLLAFSRKQTLEFKAVEINKVVAGFEKFLRRTIQEDVKLELFLSPDPLTVMADVGQIEQVLINLAVNAADAMPYGGTLTIETARVDLDEKYAAEHTAVEPGPYVLIAVSDTGCGMDNETQENIFEPFFTTKGEGGTGMGLATVYGIVKQHGGNIWVYSEPGKGATFKIYLPVCEAAHVEETSGKKEMTDLTGNETILLAEDNEQVRDLVRAILERQGYIVLTAENGKEALSILESHDRPLHLLLTDLVMPEMSGRDLFAKAAERHPDLKVLYMSGYTDNVIAHRGVLDEGIAFIQKPFSVNALAAKVREVLDSPGDTPLSV